ncbi:Gfo/Idh/MocA family oxidoreductase [Horticoccus luteus]|uniref:Gfo/Idh/MocA family oxidoreductase n=1 Tax=Horticoccus luteus TaxID=2862869 RepID=A0A8F9XGX3_9BACT|nr:Gfo/Idh/MocA family oxidoreductase [Horticoccus luteus]QYM78700.1 Gfo/Idh/MocA family oxidoreductase [Horticoccus luteus]
MKKTYHAVLVGTGGIGAAHVNAVNATAGRVKLVAACDIDAGRARAFCDQHQIPGAHTDYATMLKETKPDIVLIAAPPGLHAGMSIAAMESGAWVLCEKPLCASLAELDQIQTAENATGRYTSCVFQMRFATSNQHIRRLLNDGVFGRPLLALCNTVWFRDAAYYAVPWRGKWSTELGGPTMSQGIHTMDHLLHLFGEWSEVRAVVDTLHHKIEVEDLSMAHVKFANGARAAIVNSTVCPRQETYLRLDCVDATIELTHLYAYTRENWKMTPAAPEKSAAMQAAWDAFPTPDVGSTHGAQLNEIVGHMDAGTRPLTSGDEARRTLEFLTAIYKSAFTNQPVTRGSIRPGDPFYTALHGGMAPARSKG